MIKYIIYIKKFFRGEQQDGSKCNCAVLLV